MLGARGNQALEEAIVCEVLRRALRRGNDFKALTAPKVSVNPLFPQNALHEIEIVLLEEQNVQGLLSRETCSPFAQWREERVKRLPPVRRDVTAITAG